MIALSWRLRTTTAQCGEIHHGFDARLSRWSKTSSHSVVEIRGEHDYYVVHIRLHPSSDYLPGIIVQGSIGRAKRRAAREFSVLEAAHRLGAE